MQLSAYDESFFDSSMSSLMKYGQTGPTSFTLEVPSPSLSSSTPFKRSTPMEGIMPDLVSKMHKVKFPSK